MERYTEKFFSSLNKNNTDSPQWESLSLKKADLSLVLCQSVFSYEIMGSNGDPVRVKGEFVLTQEFVFELEVSH